MQSLIIRALLTARLVKVLADHSLASLAMLFLCLNVTDALPTVTAGIASVGILARLIRLLPPAQKEWSQVTRRPRSTGCPKVDRAKRGQPARREFRQEQELTRSRFENR